MAMLFGRRLKLHTRDVLGVTVVDVSGRITAGAGSSAMRDILRDLVASGKKKILLNLTDVRCVDNAGIGELIFGFRMVENAGGSLKLLGLSKRVKEVLATRPTSI